MQRMAAATRAGVLCGSPPAGTRSAIAAIGRPGRARDDRAGAARELAAASIVGPRVPSPAGPATPARRSGYTIEAEPAFFLDGFACRAAVRRRRPQPDASAAPTSRSTTSPRRCGVTDVTAARRSRSGKLADAAAAARLRAPRPAATSRSRTPASPRSRPTARYAVTSPATLRGRATARRSATRGSASSRTGTARRSPASATATACGRRTAGPLLPFYARNLRTITQWAFTLDPAQLMPTLLELQTPQLQPCRRRATARPGAWSPSPPTASSRTGSTIGRRCRPAGTGLVWAAVRDGEHAAAHPPRHRRRRAHARVDRPGHQPRHHRQGQPAEHAGVRHAPRHRRAGGGRRRVDRPPRQQRVLARHHRRRRRGDGARRRRCAIPTTGTSSPSSSPPRRTATSPTSAATGTRASCRGSSAPTSTCTKREPLLRGTVFTDRGVYRLGEEVHVQGDPAAEHARRASGCCPTARRCSSACATARTSSSTSARSRSPPGAAPSGR